MLVLIFNHIWMENILLPISFEMTYYNGYIAWYFRVQLTINRSLEVLTFTKYHHIKINMTLSILQSFC